MKIFQGNLTLMEDHLKLLSILKIKINLCLIKVLSEPIAYANIM